MEKKLVTEHDKLNKEKVKRKTPLVKNYKVGFNKPFDF